MALIRNNTRSFPDIYTEDAEEFSSGSVGELKATKTVSEQDLQKELLAQWDQDATIDKFEQMHGGPKPKAPKVPDYVWKTIVLRPESKEHNAILQRIMNDKPKYKIVQMQTSFVGRGDCKVFLLYGEAVDTKKEEKPHDTETPKP